MTTAPVSIGTIITDALRDIGAVALEETPTAAEMAVGLRVVNNMLDSWGTESLMVYGYQPTVYTYTSFKQLYTLGPGGDFNGPRTNKLELAYNRDVYGNDFPIYVTEDYQEYAGLVVKNTPSPYVQMIYINYGFPQNELYIWPVPNSATYSLVLWTWQNLQSFTTLADTVILPPGYNPAIEYNLAVDLGPKFGRTISPDLRDLANKYKAQVKRINVFDQEMQFDDRIAGNGAPSYADLLSFT